MMEAAGGPTAAAAPTVAPVAAGDGPTTAVTKAATTPSAGDPSVILRLLLGRELLHALVLLGPLGRLLLLGQVFAGLRILEQMIPMMEAAGGPTAAAAPTVAPVAAAGGPTTVVTPAAMVHSAGNPSVLLRLLLGRELLLALVLLGPLGRLLLLGHVFAGLRILEQIPTTDAADGPTAAAAPAPTDAASGPTDAAAAPVAPVAAGDGPTTAVTQAATTPSAGNPSVLLRLLLGRELLDALVLLGPLGRLLLLGHVFAGLRILEQIPTTDAADGPTAAAAPAPTEAASGP